MRTTTFSAIDHIPESVRFFVAKRLAELSGFLLLVASTVLALALVSWSVQDPSLNHATAGHVRNLMGPPGAVVADLLMQLIGVAASAMLVPVVFWGWRLMHHRKLERIRLRLILWSIGIVCAASVASSLPVTDRWPLPSGLGGLVGDVILVLPHRLFGATG